MTPQRSTGEWSRAVRQQASVARVGQLGLRGGDLDELLGQALLAVADGLGVASAALLELLPEGQELRGRAAVFGHAVIDRSLVEPVRVPAGRESMPGFTVLTGEAVVSPDLHHDERFRARVAEHGIDAQAAITAPVGWGERPWGVLGAYRDRIGAWSDDDVHFVQSMANTIGLAIARQRAEDQLRDSSARLDLSLGAGGLGAWSWDFATNEVELSTSALAIYGIDPEAFDGSGDSLLGLVHPDDRDTLRGAAGEALQATGEQHDVYRVVRPVDGQTRWIESWGRLLEQDGRTSRLVGVVSDITGRRLADETREALLAGEKRARAEAEQAHERLSVLAEASARFSGSLDPDVILASLPEFCVPLLADVCLVDVYDDEGRLHDATGSAADEQSLADCRALRVRQAEPGGEGGIGGDRQAVDRTWSVFEPTITDEQYQAAAVDDEHLALLRRCGPRSSIAVPLIARGRVIGVLTVMVTRPGRQYGPDHLVLVEDLAARAALALDNGRLFESRNRVTRSLQAALLPPALPDVDRLGLAARYRVAEGDIEVGGDFYDVIEVGERVWGVVVGDVCGRGPDAAALTGLVRHSVRTAVVRESLPSRILAQTNDAVLDQIDDARFCTAAYLRIEVDEDPTAPVRVVASSAGHPRPAVLRAEGGAELVDCAGLLLGVVASPSLVDAEVSLHPGDSVVLYTDGVTEARQGMDFFGEDRLVKVLRDLVGADADGIAAGLEAAVSDYQDDASDDVAIVVVQVLPPCQPESVERRDGHR